MQDLNSFFRFNWNFFFAHNQKLACLLNWVSHDVLVIMISDCDSTHPNLFIQETQKVVKAESLIDSKN